MTKDKSRIQSCIDHINTAVDVDPWAKELVAEMGKEILKAQLSGEGTTSDCISRQAAIDFIDAGHLCNPNEPRWSDNEVVNFLKSRPSAQQLDKNKYEYHYDHTDCIWYRPEARNRCPSTCAQYRDGWNDAMNYVFRDGKGYRPYRRDQSYGE